MPRNYLKEESCFNIKMKQQGWLKRPLGAGTGEGLGRSVVCELTAEPVSLCVTLHASCTR